MAKQKIVFQADDGEEFDTLEACREHEKNGKIGALAGLTLEEIIAGIQAESNEVRDAVTAAFHLVQGVRKERGHVKPRKRPHESVPTPAAAA